LLAQVVPISPGELARQAEQRAQREMYQRLEGAPRDTALWAAYQPDCPDDIRREIYELALASGGGYGAQSLLDSPEAMRCISDQSAAAAVLRWANSGFIKDPVSRLMRLPQCGAEAIAKAAEKWPTQISKLRQHHCWTATADRQAQKTISSTRVQWETWLARQSAQQPEIIIKNVSFPAGHTGYTALLWLELNEQGRDQLASIAPPEHIHAILDRAVPYPGTGTAGRRIHVDLSAVPTQHQLDLMWARPSPRTPTTLKNWALHTYHRLAQTEAEMAVPASWWEDTAHMKNGKELWYLAASNPDCPAETLEQILRKTSSADTQKAALQNRNLPTHVRAMWQLAH